MNEKLLGLEQDWGLDSQVGYGLGVTPNEGWLDNSFTGV